MKVVKIALLCYIFNNIYTLPTYAICEYPYKHFFFYNNPHKTYLIYSVLSLYLFRCPLSYSYHLGCLQLAVPIETHMLRICWCCSNSYANRWWAMSIFWHKLFPFGLDFAPMMWLPGIRLLHWFEFVCYLAGELSVIHTDAWTKQPSNFRTGVVFIYSIIIWPFPPYSSIFFLLLVA